MTTPNILQNSDFLPTQANYLPLAGTIDTKKMIAYHNTLT